MGMLINKLRENFTKCVKVIWLLKQKRTKSQKT
jgi:hypothetical protein